MGAAAAAVGHREHLVWAQQPEGDQRDGDADGPVEQFVEVLAPADRDGEEPELPEIRVAERLGTSILVSSIGEPVSAVRFAFIAAADEAVAQEAWKIFTKVQGLDIELGVTLGEVKQSKKSISIQYIDQDSSSKTFECDRLVVAVGRVPNTEGLGAENVGLKLDARGFIEVDKNCRTTLPRVYAVGDVVRGPMLAHKGEDEGVMVAEIIAGHKADLHWSRMDLEGKPEAVKKRFLGSR